VSTFASLAVSDDVSAHVGAWTHTWYGKFGLMLAILLLAFIVRWVAFRILDRLIWPVAAATAATPSTARILSAGKSPERAAERAQQRTQTLLSVSRSLVTVTVFAVAFAAILSVYGVSLTAILASAGILSVALGFGAQSLVRDYLSGLAIILEDQYGVGDVIDTGEAIGTVEQVSLRITRLRDTSGVVWFVPNGQIVRVANRSRGSALVTVDIPIAAGQDPQRALDVMAAALAGLVDQVDALLEQAEVVGVESVGPTGIVLRCVAKTRPDGRLPVAREMRGRILTAFEAEGIALASVPPVAGGGSA
jgi:small-conductance mechanosensitive channel